MHLHRIAVCVATLFIAAVPALPALASPSTLQQAVSSPDRSPKFVARDPARHPAEELAFFGVTPTSNLVEIWPGGGYWTEILAPLLHDAGSYTAALGTTDGDRAEQAFALSPAFRTKLDADPARYGRVRISEFGAHHLDLMPPGQADLVLTFRNLHNWLEAQDAPQMLAAIHRILKPGGTLGIEDHRANPALPDDPLAGNGYVRQDDAIRMVERAGFRLTGSSELDANPRDTANWPKGVWTLPPTLLMGQKDRQKYLSIGEADNFVLRFNKTGT